MSLIELAYECVKAILIIGLILSVGVLGLVSLLFNMCIDIATDLFKTIMARKKTRQATESFLQNATFFYHVVKQSIKL